jgi:seryl-tRNA(Sec) selenium transferase
MAFFVPLARALRRFSAGMKEREQSEAHRALEDKIEELDRRLRELETYVQENVP